MMKRNETRVNRIKAVFDRKIREASRQSIVNSSLTDDKLRLMMRVCNLAPKWLSSLENKMYKKIAPLNCEVWKSAEPVAFEHKENGKHMVLNVGDVWSDTVFDCGWFHITGDIPKQDNAVCLIDISGEGLVYANDGTLIKGITTYASEFSYEFGLPVKKVIPITESIIKNGKIDFYIDGACNDLQGNLCNSGKIMLLETAVCRDDIRQVKYDLEVLLGLFDSLTEADAEYRFEIAQAIDNAHNFILKKDYASAHNEFGKILDKPSESDFEITAHGHGHLDLAWLWPIRETKRKGARTFSSQLFYTEKYNDYVFGASQAQLFLWMKEGYPELYSRITKAVKQGRITIQGAAWVESDVNLPCAESLIRQFLYGKKFFKNEFGINSNVLWLPDTFGYSGSLPQIVKKCGMNYFITQKLSWNTVNEFPYQTFNWKGTDGSCILAHLLPANTYNGPLNPEEMLRVQNTYKEKSVSNNAMIAYGVGDGGGGPSMDHLERLKRVKNLKGLPKINTVSTDEFMEKLAQNREKYPTYQGELYLERHRGTYTTQAKNKKYNRKMEIALRDCEFFSSVANKLCGFDYPFEEIETLWKETLLYQFHDILPGSSIARVYDESVKRYEIIYNKTKALTEKACKAISDYYNSSLFFNSLPWKRNGIEPMGISSKIDSQENAFRNGNTLENSFIKLVFSEKGEIISLYNKKQSKEYANGNINVFKLYNDTGDCWDIEPVYYYAFEPETAKLKSMTYRDDAVELEFSVGNSVIKQVVRLCDDTVQFDTYVNWNEKNKMLRVDFPITVENDFASYQIQYGHIKRPTTHNDSISRAMFEVSAHKWCDLSGKENGISLINDCKYGYRIWDSNISMNVLRSPNYPGKKADIGEHHFRYALYTHTGQVDDSRVYEKAFEFNTPVISIGNTAKSDISKSFIKTDNDKIIIDSVKKSEDKKGYIIKMYNCSEQEQSCRIISDLFNVTAQTDFVENIIGKPDDKIIFGKFEAKAFYAE